MLKVSIVMPAYNEEKRIGPTLKSYSDYFSNLKKNKILDYELIVVINNTKDKTEQIVKKYSKTNKNISYLNLTRGGKGYAVIEGFKEALKTKSNLIGFVDADLATPPQAFNLLISRIKNSDGIIASRYIAGSTVNPAPTIRRRIVSRIFNLLIRALFLMPYRDTQCGAKLFKRLAIENSISQLTMSNWAFDVDLLYTLRKNGYVIRETPTIWSDKKYSKIDFMKAGPKMVLGIIRLRIISFPFRDFIKLYDFFTKN